MTKGSGKDQNSALEAWLSRKKKKPAAGISSRPKGEPAVLSHGQERLWLLEQLYPDQNLYHYAHRYRIEGPINLESLLSAFQQLAERHEVIKSRYEVKDSIAIQVTSSDPLPVKHYDLKDLSIKEQEEELRSETRKLCTIPFNLEKEALFRIYCFHLFEQSFEILIVLHHIIGDAWSMSIINRELAAIYDAKVNLQTELPDLEIQYQDFAWWQRQQEIKKSDLDFWKEKLSGELPVLNLPFKRGSGSGFEGKVHKRKLPSALKERLKSLAQQEEVTMFSLLLAGFKVLLSKYSDQTDIIVGSPFSNRDQKALEKLVGFFNETLVLRTEVSPELSFGKLLKRVKNNTLEALSHKNVPFDTLVNELKVERQAGENPLFQTMFLYNAPGEKLSLGEGIDIDEEVLGLPISKFDLTLFVNERAEDLELVFEHSTDFEAGIIEDMSGHFQSLLENLLNAPEEKLKEISLFSEEEIRQQANFWQGKKVDLPHWKSVHALIVNQAKEKLDQVAVVTSSRSLTYQELDNWSNQVAEKLQAEGVQPNDFIGLLTPRSVEMIVGILGILKAGAAYLPLDPDYPEERLEFMLADSQAKVVLAHPQLKNQYLGKSKLLLLEEDPDYNPREANFVADHLNDYAYVIYTSGSTGQPKGVPVTHENLLHSTLARFDFFEDEMERFLLLSSFSFDSSIVGIFWSLCTGGTLVLPEKHIEQDVSALTDLIEKEKVSHTLMLPSLYQVILGFANPKKLESLKAVMVAGEACSTGLKDLHFTKLPQTRLYNEYGPTEATVWCIAHEITKDDDQIPIGRPIPNYQAYLLNSQRQPLPIGCTGELYIGGKGVTGGYLNRPELTSERFVDDPFFEGGTKMYKTGDLARFRSDGIIEFLGRADEQVKIRGFRVEPEEIRNRILQHEEISEAIVKFLEDRPGNKQLVAWVQTDLSDIENSLRAELKSTVPDYMVPSHILPMTSLPKLPNGKIDVRQLPTPKDAPTSEKDYKAASNEKESLLVEIWQEVLGTTALSTHDNFFDIGGDSIQSIRIVAKAREKGLTIGPTDIFKFQDIETLAKRVSWLKESANSEEGLTYPFSFPLSFQQQGFLLHSLQAKEDQGFLQLEFSFSGNLNEEVMQKAWQKVTENHPVMRTSFHWENLEAPHQTIHKEAPLSWKFMDFSQSESSIEELVANFKEEDIEAGFDLTKPGGGRLALLKIRDANHLLIWTCHHILVDGWSGAIVLEDVLYAYDRLHQDKPTSFDPVPHFGKFLDWKANQDQKKAKTFWKEMFRAAEPPLFSNGQSSASPQFRDCNIYPDSAIIGQLENLTRQERLTINSVLQGLWMLTLASYFSSKEISLGLTLTGRSSDFPGIDRITGLLMSVLPVRKDIDDQMNLSEWLKELQNTLNQLREFEYIDTNQVQEWTGAENRPLFDSLFVFGNFMNEALTVGNLTVDEFRGGFSATFPLTIRVNPATQLEFNCRYDANIVEDEVAVWLLKTYESVLNKVVARNDFEIPLAEVLTAPPTKNVHEAQVPSKGNESDAFSSTRNQTEFELLRIWEKVIGAQLIGIHDKYIEVGGTSLGAIRLFAEIEKQFGKKLSPTTIVSHPTIATQAVLLGAKEEEKGWSSIVPMKTSGDALPLFCVHSGGAHVLFYQGLAKYMSPERPVYAIQPTGIDGEEEMHENIPQMASHYIEEMQKIQPHGPYHLIGTCFGNAVGLEMAHQLKEKGEELAVLYIIDSAPAYLIPPSPNGERKPVSRMAAMIKKGDWRAILKKFKGRYARVQRKLNSGQKTEQELELDEIVDSLNDMYVKYTWRPLEDKIVLIRSSEFSQRKDKYFHLDRWEFLAGDKLEVYEVEGSHLTLFEEPEVKGLTQKVVEHMGRLKTD